MPTPVPTLQTPMVISDTQLNLPFTLNGAVAINVYYSSTSANQNFNLYDTEFNMSPAPIMGLSPGTTYWFYAQGVDESGTPSTNSTPPVTNSTMPLTVTIQQATAASDTQINVTFTTSVSCVSVDFFYSTDNIHYTDYDSWFNPPNAMIMGLNPSTNYYLAAQAQDAAGNVGPMIKWPNNPVQTLPLTATLAPSSFSDTQITLSLSASISCVSVDISYSTDGTHFSLYDSGFMPPTALIIGLDSGQKYWFQAQGVDAAGNVGPASTPVGPITTSLPPVPQNITLNVASDTEIDLQYNLVGTAVAANVYYSTDNVTYSEYGSGYLQTAQILGLTPNTKYYFKLQGVNAAGYAGDFTAPGAYYQTTSQPTVSITGTAQVSDTQISVTFVPSSTCVAVNIFYSSDGGNTYIESDQFNVLPNTQTTGAVAGLTMATSYLFKAQGIDSIGFAGPQSLQYGPVLTSQPTVQLGTAVLAPLMITVPYTTNTCCTAIDMYISTDGQTFSFYNQYATSPAQMQLQVQVPQAGNYWLQAKGVDANGNESTAASNTLGALAVTGRSGSGYASNGLRSHEEHGDHDHHAGELGHKHHG